MKLSTSIAACLLVLALAGVPAAAQLATPSTTTQVTVSGGTATVSVATALYELDASLAFEQVVGLSVSSLGLSSEVVDPLDPALLARLPSGVTVPAAMPLLVAIEPPATGALSFSGLATLELHTHDLAFTAGCPLRIFASHDGGTFEDVTDFMGMGSYRARGRTGGFSDFLILADSRLAADVVDVKLDRVWSLLDIYESDVDPAVFSDLGYILRAAEAAWQAGDTGDAKEAIDAFGDAVKEASSSEIPDVWRSARDLVNVAGELRAAAATLRFSLSLAS